MYSSLQLSNNIILYVEDDEITRKSLALIIKKKYPGITLLSAANGKEGLEIFMRERPGLVITDIIMPVMDGRRMIEGIRAVDPEVGVIVTSACCDVELFTNDIGLENSNYLCKPVDINKLFGAIDAWITEQNMARENNRSAGVG